MPCCDCDSAHRLRAIHRRAAQDHRAPAITLTEPAVADDQSCSLNNNMTVWAAAETANPVSKPRATAAPRTLLIRCTTTSAKMWSETVARLDRAAEFIQEIERSDQAAWLGKA